MAKKGLLNNFKSMFEEPSTGATESPQKNTEYQAMCKYQVGPFQTELKTQNIKL